MSLAHAVLTALVERSCSGSELARRFDRSIGYFWPATHQQIYRELSRLERDGWVASASGEAARGRRRVYDVLPAGREELRRWLAEPRGANAVRDELLVKLRAEAALSQGTLRESLVVRLKQHRERLAAYRDIDATSFRDAAPTREQRLQRLILKAGLDVERLWIGLCKDALAILDDD